MSVEDLEAKVIEWAKERGIFAASTDITRWYKLREEVVELEDEVMSLRSLENIKLEAGDVLVTLINLLHPYGLNLETCLAAAYQKIKDRTGRMENGTFVKDK